MSDTQIPEHVQRTFEEHYELLRRYYAARASMEHAEKESQRIFAVTYDQEKRDAAFSVYKDRRREWQELREKIGASQGNMILTMEDTAAEEFSIKPNWIH